MGYIYKIVNLINNKCYVGQTRLKYVSNRFAKHKTDLKNNCGHNPHLQNSWNKYGGDKFKFELLEIIDDSIIDEREQYWIDKLKPEYNIRSVAKSNFGLKWREESIAKVKGKKMSLESKIKMSNANKGKRLSKETKQKLSIINTGRTSPNKGKKFSKEIREKMSKSRQGKKLSTDHKNKIKIANTGKVFSKEQKVNISNGIRNSYIKKIEQKLNKLSYQDIKNICINLDIKFNLFSNKIKLIKLIANYKYKLNKAVIDLKILNNILNKYNII